MVTNHPRAHVLNAKSMEIFRKLKLEQQIVSMAPPKEFWTKFRYCGSLLSARPDLAVKDHVKTREYSNVLINSPCRVTQLSQPVVEEILRLEAHNSLDNGSAILYNHELRAIDLAKKNCVIRNLLTKEDFEIAPELVIGSDGAKSLLREACGIQLEGEQFLESFASVYFESSVLGEQVISTNKSAMLSFIFNPEVIFAVIVIHDPRNEGRFVAHLPFFPPSETYQEFERRVPSLIANCLFNAEDESPSLTRRRKHEIMADVKIKSLKSWGMHGTLANRFMSSNGFVTLVGDAAHQFPPSGGFGLNVGLGEVDNLVTHLVESKRGKKSTVHAVQQYETERRPIARATLDVALDNYQRGLKPAIAMGLTRSAMNLASTYVPSQHIRNLAKIPMAMALKNDQGLEELKRVVEERNEALPMFFPHVDLDTSVNHPNYKLFNNGAYSQRQNTIGKMVKHVWLNRNNERVSTVDIATALPGAPTLFMRANSEVVVITKEGSKVLLDDGESNLFFEKDVLALVTRMDGVVAVIVREGNHTEKLTNFFDSNIIVH